MVRRKEGGFTLLELITVIGIISILTGIAIPQYRAAIVQAKEAVLREDLFRFRDTIDQYQADKGVYPASLQALVEQGYLRSVPNDPMTLAADWLTVPAELDPADPSAEPGVYDVKSASIATSLSGIPYAEW